MSYWLMGYDQGGKAPDRKGKLPFWVEGFVFPEFTRDHHDWDLNPWGLKEESWWDNARDGMWYVNAAKQFDLDFFTTPNPGFLISDRFVEATRDLWSEPHRLFPVHVVNKKRENNSVRPMYYYLDRKGSADIFDCSRLVEDGAHCLDLYGPVETALDEAGHRYIVRAPEIPLKPDLPHFFRTSSKTGLNLFICSDEFRRRVQDARLRGPSFIATDDCLIADFGLQYHSEKEIRIFRYQSSAAMTKAERRRWDGMDNLRWRGEWKPPPQPSFKDFSRKA